MYYPIMCKLLEDEEDQTENYSKTSIHIEEWRGVLVMCDIGFWDDSCTDAMQATDEAGAAHFCSRLKQNMHKRCRRCHRDLQWGDAEKKAEAWVGRPLKVKKRCCTGWIQTLMSCTWMCTTWRTNWRRIRLRRSRRLGTSRSKKSIITKRKWVETAIW